MHFDKMSVKFRSISFRDHTISLQFLITIINSAKAQNKFPNRLTIQNAVRNHRLHVIGLTNAL